MAVKLCDYQNAVFYWVMMEPLELSTDVVRLRLYFLI